MEEIIRRSLDGVRNSDIVNIIQSDFPLSIKENLLRIVTPRNLDNISDAVLVQQPNDLKILKASGIDMEILHATYENIGNRNDVSFVDVMVGENLPLHDVFKATTDPWMLSYILRQGFIPRENFDYLLAYLAAGGTDIEVASLFYEVSDYRSERSLHYLLSLWPESANLIELLLHEVILEDPELIAKLHALADSNIDYILTARNLN